MDRRKIVLLTNPAAGKGRAAASRDAALIALRASGISVRSASGRDADEALDLARRAVADEVDALVVCGGDGMVNLGVQATAGTTVPLGIIPAGTGNDAAASLGVPTSPVAAARHLVAAMARSPRRVDLGRVGGRYFITVLAAGFDAVVNERANRMRRPRGQMRYNLATLLELPTFRPLTYTVERDGVEARFEAMMVAVGNGPSYGGGLRITEGARIDDGLLDVVVIGPMSKPGLIRTFPRLFTGTHTTHPQYSHSRVSRISIAAPGIVAYADGERFGPLPLTVDSAPGALGVLA